jgi:hypothetical protein
MNDRGIKLTCEVTKWDDWCAKCHTILKYNRMYWFVGAPTLCYSCDAKDVMFYALDNPSVLPESTGSKDKKE